MTFPAGLYVGFASTSIVEVLIAGYEEPGLPEGVSLPGASILTACESREAGGGSPAGMLADGAFDSLTRGACLKYVQQGRKV